MTALPQAMERSPHAGALAAYGALGLPLAMAALPVYVQAPSYYAGTLGLPLALTGVVMFAARLVDTVQDPWLGRWVDAAARAGRLAPLLGGAAALLALAFAGLWLPLVQGTAALAFWLAAMLVLAYSAHSVLQIAHLAWGARIGPQGCIVRAAAWREGLGLAGVVAASALPPWLMAREGSTAGSAMAVFAVGFAVLLAAGTALLLWRAPRWQAMQAATTPAWRQALALPGLRALLLPYFLNAVSVALPATLALFFIADRIAAPQWAGLFLGSYFVAGAVGLPAWSRLARRIGPARAWRRGMGLSVVAFCSCALLGPGDVLAYGAICVLAGLALGADLALPPVLLAAQIPPGEQPGSYYGLWTLLGKLALATSGLALPLLAALGYTPGQPQGTGSLALLYAGLPCLFKLSALWALSRGPLAASEVP